MNLRSFLHRRQANRMPLLPESHDDSALAAPADPGGILSRRARAAARDEHLERLLTPSELEIVQHHLL